MTGSNSMSSGYCSLDEESEDFTFFTAKTTFFRQPKKLLKNEVKEEEGGPKVLSEEEVRARIEDYNSKVSENGMSLATDGSYTGFIKVRLRLSRPVTVSVIEAGGIDAQPDLAEKHQEGAGGAMSDKRTSFYMPTDCVKQIHISSSTTVKEVIQGLLKKYMVLDNPRKFALYRQTHRDGQDWKRGPDAELLSFVLKENETEEWHAFSVPELQNFLVILDKEETERVRLVKQRFEAYREKLQKALQENQP
uniref:Ras association domain family member 5 n=1 Tax=Esox lucius TaxID=8010 RepID=A0A3P8ZA40_ESOLU